MFILLIIIFLLAMGLGGYLLSYLWNNKNTPKGVALIHGGMGAVGIILLIVYSINHPLTFISVGVFILAALGGIFLFACDILGKKIPNVLGAAHGLIAIIGFVLLVILGLNYF